MAIKGVLPLSSIEADVWCNVVWVKGGSLNGDDNCDEEGGGSSVSENSSQSSDISTTWLASELS